MVKFNLSNTFPCRDEIMKWLRAQKPQDWLKWIVLIICLGIVYFQFIDCLWKLRHPPITSHSYLTLNDTLHYPALTICREPPYNRKVFPKFNFTSPHVGSFPYSSLWRYFPYEIYKVSDFWDEAMYNESVFTSFGLDGKNVEMTSSVNLQSGMCYTIRPKYTVAEVGKRSGYSLLLNHDMYDYKPLVDEEPGWKIYVHEQNEKFTENINLMSSRQDHVFVPVGEVTEISIDAYQFDMLKNCTRMSNYSVTACEENCTIEEDIKPNVQCSGPWLPDLGKPLCHESYGMRSLIKATYMMRNKNCCMKKCKTTYYKVFVVKRTQTSPEKNLTSTALIYFSSKAVITMEERYSYNWGDFLGEIGGTVGFLLGLSIVGLFGVVEKFIEFIFAQKEEKIPDVASDINKMNMKLDELDKSKFNTAQIWHQSSLATFY